MSDQRIEDLGDDLAVPRKNGELVFEAPWEGRVFGMAVALSDDEVYAWDAFRDRLVGEIAAAEAARGQLGLLRALAGVVRAPPARHGRAQRRGARRPHRRVRHRRLRRARALRDDLGRHRQPDALAAHLRGPATSSGARTGSRSTSSGARGSSSSARPAAAAATPSAATRRCRSISTTASGSRRRIRHKVHLSLGGCLGPCALSNVVLLLFAGQEIWFHSVTGDEQVIAIYDYIEAMVRADRYLPPPPALAPQVVRRLRLAGAASGAAPRPTRLPSRHAPTVRPVRRFDASRAR